MWHTYILKPKDDSQLGLHVYQGWHSTREKAEQEVDRRGLWKSFDRYQYSAIPWLTMALAVLLPFVQTRSRAYDSRGERIDAKD